MHRLEARLLSPYLEDTKNQLNPREEERLEAMTIKIPSLLSCLPVIKRQMKLLMGKLDQLLCNIQTQYLSLELERK